jgi:hypothetical protein
MALRSRHLAIAAVVLAAMAALYHRSDAGRAAFAEHVQCELREKERSAKYMAQRAMENSQLCLSTKS